MDTRGKAEAKKAEAALETEAREAEVNLMMDPMNDDPRKGQNLLNARRRRMLRLLGSVLGTKQRWAEPLSRRNRGQEKEKSTMSLEKVRWKDLWEVFGKR